MNGFWPSRVRLLCRWRCFRIAWVVVGCCVCQSIDGVVFCISKHYVKVSSVMATRFVNLDVYAGKSPEQQFVFAPATRKQFRLELCLGQVRRFPWISILVITLGGFGVVYDIDKAVCVRVFIRSTFSHDFMRSRQSFAHAHCVLAKPNQMFSNSVRKNASSVNQSSWSE